VKFTDDELLMPFRDETSELYRFSRHKNVLAGEKKLPKLSLILDETKTLFPPSTVFLPRRNVLQSSLVSTLLLPLLEKFAQMKI
jgi:hypothetical protein